MSAPFGLILHEERIVLRGEIGTPQITPRVWRALVCVVSAYPRAVSYDDLDAAIWPDRPAAWKRVPPRSPVVFDLRAALSTVKVDVVRRGKGYAIQDMPADKTDEGVVEGPAPVTLPRVRWLERPMPNVGSINAGARS